MYFACRRLKSKELKSMSSQDDESTGKDEGEVKYLHRPRGRTAVGF
jgi:hypothetical protein